MKANEYIIVIGRQFGSGGRLVGKELSRRLGIPYYDKELLKSAARRFGFSEEIFSHADECRPSLFGTLLGGACGPIDGRYSISSMSKEGLYKAQSEVIRETALGGPCVIVGRTADYVLRDFRNMKSIFLHATDRVKADRIIRRGDCTTLQEALQMAKKNDRLREQYYNFFTGRQWGVASNYDLCLDASSDPEVTADIIISYLDRVGKKTTD